MRSNARHWAHLFASCELLQYFLSLEMLFLLWGGGCRTWKPSTTSSTSSTPELHSSSSSNKIDSMFRLCMLRQSLIFKSSRSTLSSPYIGIWLKPASSYCSERLLVLLGLCFWQYAIRLSPPKPDERGKHPGHTSEYCYWLNCLGITIGKC